MADSVQDILEEWVCEYHTTGITPNGVKIVFMEYTEGFDDDAQEGYIDENQPIYEVMIHKQSAEDNKEFSEDYDVEDEEMIIYHITYNILENWFIVEPVVSKTAEVYLSESEIEILLNKIQDNIH
jgi:hypothetical protein